MHNETIAREVAVRSSIVMLSGALVLLAACQSGVPKAAQLQSGAELRQAIGTTGRTAWGHTPSGAQFVSYASPDGMMKVHSGNFSDVGRWHISKDGRFCDQWHKTRNGAMTCLTVYRDGTDIYYVLPSGEIASVVTRTEAGNPLHL